MASPWHRLVNPHYDLFSLLQEAGLNSETWRDEK
jgi:hypothetical protein